MNKNKKCIDCGNNYVPHPLLYLVQTATYLSSQKFAPNINGNGNIIRLSNLVLDKLHILTWKKEFSTSSSRTKAIIDASHSYSIDLRQQYFFGQPTDTFRYNVGKSWQEFYSLPAVNDDVRIRHRLDNKWQTKQILQELGSATPKGFVVRNKKQLETALKKLTYPVIIKPAQGSRGRHTHVFLRNKSEVFSAYENAKKICRYIICEEMILGDVYRFTTIFGKTAAVLRGEVPQVIGDGKHTIRQLINEKNKRREVEIAELRIDKSMIDILFRQDKKLDDIPRSKEKIILGQKIGLRYGGDAVEVTPEVHKSFIKAIDKVAGNIPLTILGFDVIANNISELEQNQKWGIIEINTIPFIDLHLHPRVGKPVDVANILWSEIIQRAQE